MNDFDKYELCIESSIEYINLENILDYDYVYLRESVGDTIKKIINAVKKFIISLKDKIKSFFSKIFRKEIKLSPEDDEKMELVRKAYNKDKSAFNKYFVDDADFNDATKTVATINKMVDDFVVKTTASIGDVYFDKIYEAEVNKLKAGTDFLLSKLDKVKGKNKVSLANAIKKLDSMSGVLDQCEAMSKKSSDIALNEVMKNFNTKCGKVATNELNTLSSRTQKICTFAENFRSSKVVKFVKAYIYDWGKTAIGFMILDNVMAKLGVERIKSSFLDGLRDGSVPTTKNIRGAKPKNIKSNSKPGDGTSDINNPTKPDKVTNGGTTKDSGVTKSDISNTTTAPNGGDATTPSTKQTDKATTNQQIVDMVRRAQRLKQAKPAKKNEQGNSDNKEGGQ